MVIQSIAFSLRLGLQFIMIRLIKNGGSLSESDLALISGTELLLDMMRNRVLIVVQTKEKVEWEELIRNTTGLYHIRSLDKSDSVYQIWFELSDDLVQFEKDLMVSKLARN